MEWEKRVVLKQEFEVRPDLIHTPSFLWRSQVGIFRTVDMHRVEIMAETIHQLLGGVHNGTNGATTGINNAPDRIKFP